MHLHASADAPHGMDRQRKPAVDRTVRPSASPGGRDGHAGCPDHIHNAIRITRAMRVTRSERERTVDTPCWTLRWRPLRAVGPSVDRAAAGGAPHATIASRRDTRFDFHSRQHNLFPPATGRCVQTTTGSAPSSPAKGNAHDVPPWACCCLPASQEPDHVLSMVKALYEGGKVGGGNRPQRRTLVASCCV